VLYEEKPGKTTPYELVLKSNTTIGEVGFLFLINIKINTNYF